VYGWVISTVPSRRGGGVGKCPSGVTKNSK
jgi:hypothetical protein